MFSQRKTVESKNVQVQVPKKKSAWTGLDKVNLKKKFVKESNVKKKSAWTGLDKVKKSLFNGKCFFTKFFTTGHTKSLG
jgi:hypothetical protein